MKKLLIILIIGLVLISGCIYNFSIPSIKCSEGIIPERLDLKCSVESHRDGLDCLYKYTNGRDEDYRLITKQLTWLDGTKIPFPSGYCTYGYKEGENINYIYCNGLIYHKIPIKDDIVQKEKRYKINLILDSKDHNSEGYKILSAKCSKII